MKGVNKGIAYADRTVYQFDPEKTKQPEEEIERMLTPYMKTTNERRNVANDI